MGPRATRLFKASLRIVLSAAALYVVLRQVDTDHLASILQAANPGWFVGALVLYAVSKVTSSLRLTQYFRANEIFLSENMNLRLYWIGMFYNLFLPGGIGGDAYKVWVLHKGFQAPVSSAFQSVLFDRLSGLFALVILALLAAWLSFPGVSWIWMAWPAIGIAVAGLVTIHYFQAKSLMQVLWQTTFYSLAVQIAQVACAWLLLRAVGVTEYTGMYLTIFLVSSAAAVLPISIGGVGIREMVFVLAARYAPISQETAVAFSLLFFVVTALSSLPGVFVTMPTRVPGGKS